MKCLILLVAVLLVGCDSRQTMRDRFDGQEFIIVTDSAGNHYVIQHTVGNNYEVSPTIYSGRVGNPK